MTKCNKMYINYTQPPVCNRFQDIVKSSIKEPSSGAD